MEENPLVLETIKQLGYDGFTTVEKDAENIAVFNPNNVKILKVERYFDVKKQKPWGSPTSKYNRYFTDNTTFNIIPK
jgi:hypothetical protein